MCQNYSKKRIIVVIGNKPSNLVDGWKQLLDVKGECFMMERSTFVNTKLLGKSLKIPQKIYIYVIFSYSSRTYKITKMILLE